jgi:hypothetical protein
MSTQPQERTDFLSRLDRKANSSSPKRNSVTIRVHQVGRFIMRCFFYVVATAFVFAFSVPSAAALGPVAIANFYSGMCLQPADSTTGSGADIILMKCTASAAQEWIVTDNYGSGGHFVNALYGTVFNTTDLTAELCLDAMGGAANETPVRQWTCNGITNENWTPYNEPKGQNGAPLVSNVSGTNSYCLDIPGDQAAAGTKMWIYGCNGSIAQKWTVNPINYRVIPWVLGMNETYAVGKLTLFGLNIGNSTYTHTCDPTKLGSVIGQSLPPGNLELAPVTVTLTVCTPAQDAAH